MKTREFSVDFKFISMCGSGLLFFKILKKGTSNFKHSIICLQLNPTDKNIYSNLYPLPLLALSTTYVCINVQYQSTQENVKII